MKAAQAILAEHMGRVDESVTPPHGDTFEAQYRAHMAKLGARGGKASGPARMKKLTAEERSKLAMKAAKARWARRK